MSQQSFRTTREPFFTEQQLERVEESTIRILTDIGIKLPNEDIREQVRASGLRVSNDRALLERSAIKKFIAAERAGNGDKFREGPASPPDEPITLGVSQYSQNYIDSADGEIHPYTLDTLIGAAKLVDTLSDRGIRAGAPGTPMDVHPDLQPAAIYHTSLTYTRHGARPLDPRSVPGHRYVLEMADVVGYHLDGLPIYLVSPLTLAGDSFSAVIEYSDRVDSVWVLSMPSVGATAPIRVADALAMSAAEVIGSAMILSELLPHKIHWGTEIFPFDLRSMAMVYGSPENLLFQLATAEVYAWLHGTAWEPWGANIHTMAKEPGPQAAAEKNGIMTSGAMLGARHFSHGGTLSLDEIFSAEQLIIDCEIRDHVDRLMRGINADSDPETCVQDVREGIKRGFMGLDSTLAEYKNTYWHPSLFERRFLGPWREDGSPDIRQRARDEAERLIGRHDYHLPDDQQQEIDRIYESAVKRFNNRR
jgi:trimethylamine---corrinoid protein Co-methyltransferase